MKLKDLVMMDFINDETQFITTMLITGSTVGIRKGLWFEDKILDFMSSKVIKFDFDCTLNILSVALEIPTEGENE
jgi:hypothetical protein